MDLPSRLHAPARTTILVTAFGAFPGAPGNPTIGIVAALERHRASLALLGVDLRCAILPVRFAGLDRDLIALAKTHRPDVILHLGVASRRRRLSIETRAINRAGPLHPDASGRCAQQVLSPGTPQSLRATYPAQRILAALRAGGLAADLSIDAGDYVCNATLYRSLLRHAAPEVGFIHVPRPRRGSQPAARARTRRPTPADLARAILIAVRTVARRSPAPARIRGPIPVGVNLIGPDHDIDAGAQAGGTIGHKVVSRLGNRALRRDIENGQTR